MKHTKPEGKNNQLYIKTSVIIFISLVAILLFFYIMSALDYQFNILQSSSLSKIVTLSIILLISVSLGALTSFLLAKRITKPIKDIKEATHQIAKGNFNITLKASKNSSINDLIEDFNKMTQELKSIETLKSTFVSDVSHEFKTPLSVIQSYCKALRRKDLNEATRKKYENVVDTNIHKLTNLTNNILNLSKIENQQILVDKAEFLLDEQIRQCIVSLEPEWEKKNIKFDLDLPKTKYFGSKSLFEQVWQNLIGNAIKFSNNNGKISISLKSEDNKITVKISDEGMGMNEETQKHIFDKFYQGDTSRSSSGNGLGLAIVSRILKINNAQISVKSEEGKGTTFTIIL